MCAVVAGITSSTEKGVSIVSTMQTLKNIIQKDTAIQDRQRELGRNMDSGFVKKGVAQAECAIYGHEYFTYNKLTQCFYCGAKPNV